VVQRRTFFPGMVFFHAERAGSTILQVESPSAVDGSALRTAGSAAGNLVEMRKGRRVAAAGISAGHWRSKRLNPSVRYAPPRARQSAGVDDAVESTFTRVTRTRMLVEEVCAAAETQTVSRSAKLPAIVLGRNLLDTGGLVHLAHGRA